MRLLFWLDNGLRLFGKGVVQYTEQCPLIMKLFCDRSSAMTQILFQIEFSYGLSQPVRWQWNIFSVEIVVIEGFPVINDNSIICGDRHAKKNLKREPHCDRVFNIFSIAIKFSISTILISNIYRTVETNSPCLRLFLC